ncbi:hypothetical protein SEA_MRMIYAGI_53 [Mycobacterium phage MrMiyagi]|uniref:DUF932 domain-containing protein n=1 Tax=Mycobacterium phage MrMiyagi TaxID=2762395 RepID=A0A7G8LPU5_9CAUD|nr:hypothetical protein SEA_MRMIYAGI_53 [Mycobacterium phage MrMiyagi]
MSRETREWLNEFILVGNCKERPMAWHYDRELQKSKGLADNHFEDPIPYQVVVDRLFSWEPKSVPKANLVPCAKRDANFFGPQGQPYKVMPTGTWNDDYVYEGEQGIIRSDTKAHMATHGSGYKIHDYKQWLLRLQSNVLGDSLTILGAGLLRNALQAYVQVAMPRPETDDKTGLKFMPYITASTSLDGSLPTTFSAQSLLIVCDNTREMALRQAERSGTIYKAKHTSKSLDQNRIKDVREALGIVHKQADDFVAEMQELASISVTRRQWVKVLDIILPLPDPKDPKTSKRAMTIAENKREVMNHTYWRDPMMNNMQGSALGVVQAVNTYANHYSQIKGNRLERNMEKMVKGDFGDIDRKTVLALSEVLNRPELVSVS